MAVTLAELVGDCRSLSLAGMCKNAGKTTVLNQIIKELDQMGVGLGLTSIGRDGETTDAVTGTDKPQIYVKQGTIIATAASLVDAGDITVEIVGTTGITTPIGKVVLVRARSDGYVELAGPSMNTGLIKVAEYFRKLGVEKIIFDGAISRKSLCSTKVAETTILATGASLDPNMDVVVEETAFIVEMLSLLQVNNHKICCFLEQPRHEVPGTYYLFDSLGELILVPENTKLDQALGHSEYDQWQYCYLAGALTDIRMKGMLTSNIPLAGKIIMVEDSCKILITREGYQKMKRKGIRLAVNHKTEVLAVTINPYSAYGNHYDPELFKEKMSKAVNLPVFNVMEAYYG